MSRFFALVLVVPCLAACSPSDDDDDDDEGGEGEGEGERVCDPRTCDAPGEECCDVEDGQVCANTTNNFEHCGSCGQPCVEGTALTCADGACACGEGPACDGTDESTCCAYGEERVVECVDLTTNPEACGTCNTSCVSVAAEAESDRCLDGACVCGDTGEPCNGTLASTCCPDEEGGASCHNIQTEVANCGGCSQADREPRDGEADSQFTCLPEQANLCFVARCVCGIPEDVGQDPAPCEGTRQSTCCVPPNPGEEDLAVCADLDTDPLHCGECNNPCDADETCVDGACEAAE